MRNIYACFLLIALLSSICHVKGQNNPQYSFYGDFDLSFVNQNAKNNADESERLELVLLLSKYFELDDKQILDLYYRLYEIEHTSVISYTTIDETPLPFHCEDSVDTNIYVDFGTPLISNKNELKSSLYRMCFASPINKIDSKLFSSSISTIYLPSTNNLNYSSSVDISVTNLKSIEGYDVYDYSALIDKGDILIVGATKGKNAYLIPECVKGIGAGAFRGATLNSIIIPSNVISIGKNAFDNTYITSFYFLSSEVPQMDESAFGKLLNSDVAIYVPKKSEKKYKKILPSLKELILPLPKTFNDTISALTTFNPTANYLIRAGLVLTIDHVIINKNSRFLHPFSPISVNESAAYLWSKIINKEFNVEIMAHHLLEEYDVDIDTARKDCMKLLEEWYKSGIICKSNKSS